MLQKAREVKEAKEEERRRLARLRGEKPLKRGERPATPEVLRKPEDVRDDPRFAGQTEIMVTWVPIKCRDEKTVVDESALREWILFAAVEEDDGMLVYYEDIDKINKVIGEIDKHLKKIPNLEFVKDDGKKFNVEEARVERARLYELFSNERLGAETDLEIANENLKNHIAWRKSMGVELRKGETDKNTDTCSWYFRLHGTDDALLMEDLLIMKENWPGIKLAAGLRAVDGHWMAPPWVGREKFVPDGSKVSDPTDYEPLQINIAGARLQRVPSGVGLYQELDRTSTDLFSDVFSVYYGEYEAGLKNGYGLEINDTGLYVGGFERGFRLGRGRLDLADGTMISGQFGVKRHRRAPQSSKFINPYQDGVPHGNVEILFSDGGLYKGQMDNGQITGHGDYQSPFNEVLSGYFENGVLTGEKCFQQNQVGEAFMGQFHNGEMHGKGTFLNKRGDSYDGTWDSSLRHGRGVSRFVKLGAYRGYYLNNLKHGKGALEFGYGKNARLERIQKKAKELAEKKRKEAADKLDAEHGRKDHKAGEGSSSSGGTGGSTATNAGGENKETSSSSISAAAEPSSKATAEQEEDEMIRKELSEFDEIYQGYFYGGSMSNKGSVMNTKVQMPHVQSRFDQRGTLGITRLLKTEERRQKSNDRAVEKYNDMEVHVRMELAKKKRKIYNQQKHFAKKTMYQNDVYGSGVDKRLLASKTFLREERLKAISHESHAFKKAIIPRLKIPDNAKDSHLIKAFERIRPEELMRRVVLLKKLSRKSRRNAPIGNRENAHTGINKPVNNAAAQGRTGTVFGTGDDNSSLGGGSTATQSVGPGESLMSLPSDNKSYHTFDSISAGMGGFDDDDEFQNPQLERLMRDEVNEKLLQIVLSDFEEVHERQRFLKYDKIWQRAEDAYTYKRSSAV